jgi:hypothetical protein
MAGILTPSQSLKPHEKIHEKESRVKISLF